MTISELISKAKESAKNRTREENLELLKKAHILDENGNFDSNYFSKETVENDINKRKNRQV